MTSVEVTPDMRQAKVNVSIMGNDTKQKLCLAGLRSAAGYLQSKVANRIDTRYTPRLEFVLDQGVKKSIEIAEILHALLPRTPCRQPAARWKRTTRWKPTTPWRLKATAMPMRASSKTKAARQTAAWKMATTHTPIDGFPHHSAGAAAIHTD